MASATAQVRLPKIATHAIYEGKFKDRNPEIFTAGKLTTTGDSTAQCMVREKRSTSPDVVKRFRTAYFPGAGERRVHYGKALDPHLRWADEMAHGLCTQPSLTAKELANPHPTTLFQQRMLEKKEMVYDSHHKQPLGKTNDKNPGLPKGLDKEKFTFGIKVQKGDRAGELVNPDRSYLQVEEDTEVGRPLYIKSHMSYHPGEQTTRDYAPPHYGKYKAYGHPTPHDNEGKFTKKAMHWLIDSQDEKAARIVSHRLDNFRERTQPQLGKVLDPIKDTLNVAPDHTFGILYKPDEYGVGDLMHGRGAGAYLRGKERIRGLVAALRQQLKKANYQNFQNLIHAFKHYDKTGSGKIDVDQLREVCVQFDLPAEPEIIEPLFDYCDVNRDGYIDYVEFCNFLNWKDKMPTGLPSSNDKNIVKEEDLVPKSPVSRESTPRRLQKQIDRAAATYRTSASMINGVVGGLSSQEYRKYGVPSVRSDLPAPRIKRVCDSTNYGDESDAYGLTNPNIYSLKGVYEKDFLVPRPRQELRHIFEAIGVGMDLDTFDTIYKVASDRHPRGEVCVESFRSVLDELQARQMVLA